MKTLLRPAATRPALATETAILVVFFLVTLLLRWPTFLRSVMDWDESLYFLIAAQWRAGHLPYTTIWDNKPIGIYAIFALAQALLGERIAAMRAASTFCAGLTAFVVYRITLRLAGGSRPAALAAGSAFILGALSNDGLSANTEPFMACCTALAVLTAGAAPLAAWPLRRAWLTGLLLGAAFMVKYVSVCEAPAVLLLLLMGGPSAWRGRAAVAAACLAGAAIPLGATLLLYGQAGKLELWWRVSVASNFRRASAVPTPGQLRYALATQLWRWAPFYLAGLAALAAAGRRLRHGWPADEAGRNRVFLALWLLGGALGIAAARSFYDHYFLQILPALCVSLGCCASRAALFLRRAGRPAAALLLAVALALPAAAACAALRQAAAPVLALRGLQLQARPDPPARIARDLAGPLAAASGGLYVFDSEPILYALTRQPPPTRYVFPSVLTTSFMAYVAGVDAAAEVGRILAAKPLFIAKALRPRNQNRIDPAIYAIMNTALARHYRLWKVYPGIAVYQRR